MPKPAVQPSQKPSQHDTSRGKVTRDEILDAAARLIVERGYGSCTMRAIAGALNIKAGSLYYHFDSKDDIILEIMDRGVVMIFQNVTAKLNALPDTALFSLRLQTAVRAHVEIKLSTTTNYQKVYEYLPPVVKRRSREVRHRYADLWTQLFQCGKREGVIDSDMDLTLLVPFVLSALNRIPEWFRAHTMTMDDVVDMATGLLREGIVRSGVPDICQERDTQLPGLAP